MNNWYKLGDYVTSSLKGITPKYVDKSNIIVLNQRCIRDNKIDFSFSQFHDENTKFNKVKILKEGDLLFNSTGQGTAGRCAFVRELPKNKIVITDSHILIVRIEDYFLADCFNYSFFREESLIQTLMDGSTGQGELDKIRLFNIEFRLPPEKYRKSICEFLNNIDAKIEGNTKINQELEAMAKTLYDYWFVQFDFPAYLSGSLSGAEGYKSSGGKMVFNKDLKREIPEGWKAGTLLDIATYVNGLACQKYRPLDESFLPVIKIREMKGGFTNDTEKVRPNVPDRIKIFDGDILFSWSASLEVIQWAGGNGALNQHIFKVTSNKYPKSYYYFELLNYLQHFKMIADLRKTTMGHITQDHLKQSRIVIPPNLIIQQLDEKLKPILDKQVVLQKENQKLAELRDWLLPMLMNGQVRVGNKKNDEEINLNSAAEAPLFYGIESSLSNLSE